MRMPLPEVSYFHSSFKCVLYLSTVSPRPGTGVTSWNASRTFAHPAHRQVLGRSRIRCQFAAQNRLGREKRKAVQRVHGLRHDAHRPRTASPRMRRPPPRREPRASAYRQGVFSCWISLHCSTARCHFDFLFHAEKIHTSSASTQSPPWKTRMRRWRRTPAPAGEG